MIDDPEEEAWRELEKKQNTKQIKEMKTNIKELAKQAGFDVEDKVGEIWFDEGWHTSIVERFAELVAAAEREKCAELSENIVSNKGYVQASYVARAIRARGDKHD